jgi:hypothetical protein
VNLTFRRVHTIRTSGLTDMYYAIRWRMSVETIRRARTGKTWPDHPTPVDTKPRAKRGNWGDL